MDAVFEEIDQIIEKVFDEIGKKRGGFGSFTEGLAYPSMRRVLRKYYGIDSTFANIVKDFPNGNQIEFDAFGYTNRSITP